jgi:hypothetical protein
MHQSKHQMVQHNGYGVKMPENRFNYHAFTYPGSLREGPMLQVT